MTTLGERVKAERRAKGWSQAELARRVTRAGYSITQGGIAQIERRGDTEPKSIVQLAQALGLGVNWLQSTRGDKTAGVSGDDEQLSMLPSGRRGRAGRFQQRTRQSAAAPAGLRLRPRRQRRGDDAQQRAGVVAAARCPAGGRARRLWLLRVRRLDGAGLRARQHPAGQPLGTARAGRRRGLHARRQGRARATC